MAPKDLRPESPAAHADTRAPAPAHVADRQHAATEDAPQPGLRARKKAATMHHIQETALALFSANDFDAVSIEQIAAAAEVSPSTVYRYFGTKEGLVVRDEYDEPLLAAVGYHVARGADPASAFLAALDSIWEEHFVIEDASTRTRIRLWMEVPGVRAAGYLIIEERIDEFARVLAGTGRWTFPEARVLSSTVTGMLVAALRNWYETDTGGDWREHLTEVSSLLRGGRAPWAQPPRE
ncbi:TetR/AcrR family transcriptional regulator [Actinomyces howellii]|uniref:Mycofactocin system transcriptional regulator n=1 Tax=Actinomyces howellii TaxID=52771 RepID=A0A448HJT2_9ACTO|nr:TetR/AcrR family transcriptional regulator [Actinomyces howellii]VEG29965.1 mycofactocin system transcriptional regulator [Actinomyces howellii]